MSKKEESRKMTPSRLEDDQMTGPGPSVGGNFTQPVFVLSEWDECEEEPFVIRGVYSSVEELLRRYAGYDWDEDDEVELEPYYESDERFVDPDKFALSVIVIVRTDEREQTNFYVWDSAKRQEAYAPLKLYWCTTPDGGEDWFMIAHSGREAAMQHAAAEGYNPEDAEAEYVMTLPNIAQAMGDRIVGWPDGEMLSLCGAKILSEDNQRVVEIGGRTFTEGLMDVLRPDAEQS